MSVTDIYNASDDALQNMFTVRMTGPLTWPYLSAVSLPTGADDLDIRITEFNKPEVSFEMYDIHYKTLKVQKPTAKTNFSNEFSFSMRVDKYFQWYKYFELWNKAVIDTQTGGIAVDVTQLYGTCVVEAIQVSSDGSFSPYESNVSWSFGNVLPKMIPAISFTQESGEPIVAEFTFSCAYVTETGGTVLN